MTNWGKIIRDLRIEHGRSQRELAAIANVNRSTLRRLEEGRTGGQIDMIEALLAALGYDIEAIQVSEPIEVGEIIEPETESKPDLTKIDALEQARLERLESHRARYGD